LIGEAVCQFSLLSGIPCPKLNGRWARVGRRPCARRRRRIFASCDDGTEEALTLPAGALPALADLLDQLASSDAVTVFAEFTEITPEAAAGILGMSRPLVRRRMDTGLLPFRRVGTHRRIRLADALALRAREEPVRKALEALAADTEDLERTYGI